MKHLSTLSLCLLIVIISSAQIAPIGIPPPTRTYPSVKICCQIWMSKNLDVTTYRNGDLIPQVTNGTAWRTLTTGAWCYYNNDPAMGVIYGKLYNWYAVNDPRGLAPAGWHIPIDFEWTTLSKCLGVSSDAGRALKETGTTHWLSPNTGATNSSGFTGLPGGLRYSVGEGLFSDIGRLGYWWTSTLVDPRLSVSRGLFNAGGGVPTTNNNLEVGCSVRCVKD